MSTGDDSGILNIQTNETTAITVDASQNVGIGTASPTGKLDIVGTGANILMNRTSFAPKITMQKDSTEVSSIQGISGGGQLFTYGSSTTEAMRIDSSGNLLVGTTSSNGKITAYETTGNYVAYLRNTQASSPYGLYVEYTGSSPNNTGNNFIRTNDSSADRFVVRSNGGIANYSANNVNLSDQREKKDIELAPNYLDKVCSIPVKTFLFNDQTDTEKNLGAIAQEVQAVAPELVHESNWGTEEEPKIRLSIYQTDLQYALMKSIQELKQINDTQAETINALTARIVALEGQ